MNMKLPLIHFTYPSPNFLQEVKNVLKLIKWPITSRGLSDFGQIWYRVGSDDTRSTTNVQGQGVKDQGHSVM